MNLRRKILLCAMAVAAVAAVVPAAAQAGPWWYKGGVKVGDAKNKVPFKETGAVSYTPKKGPKIGPCNETVEGKLWNGAANGEDETTTHTYEVPCKTSIANCTVTAAKATNLPWPSRLALVGALIADITENVEIDFTFDKGLGCVGGGVAGKTYTFKGTTTVFYSAAEESCHTYDEESEELLFEEEPVVVSGEDCAESEGEAITAGE
jgi:hypothetical protein